MGKKVIRRSDTVFAQGISAPSRAEVAHLNARVSGLILQGTSLRRPGRRCPSNAPPMRTTITDAGSGTELALLLALMLLSSRVTAPTLARALPPRRDASVFMVMLA